MYVSLLCPLPAEKQKRSFPLKISIYRQADQNDDQAHSCIKSLFIKQYKTDYRCGNYIKCRKDRIAESFVRPWDVRPFLPQDEYPGNSENIEKKHGEYDKIKQIAIMAAQAENSCP